MKEKTFKSNYSIMQEVIEENVKHPKGTGDQILEALEKKEREVRKAIQKFIKRLQKLGVEYDEPPKIIGVNLAILELKKIMGDKLK